MNVLFRSLSSEAIENCITCLNFKFDEVYFFGYQNIIDEEKRNIKSFIESRCKVITHFKFIDNLDLNGIYSLINPLIKNSNNNYFDMTGNESILQVAMTNIAYERNIPMHIYDVINNKPINIDDDIKGSILDVDKNSTKISKININDYIKMVGGLIQNKMTKPEKGSHEYTEYLKLTSVRRNLGDSWPYLSQALQVCKADEENNLHIYSKDRELLLNNVHNKIDDKQLLSYIEILENNGLISNFRHKNCGLSFDYASEYIKKTIRETGSILEQAVYKHEKVNADDCKIGVCLDWDGIITGKNDDVINEIDVLKLNGYVLTFISCKDTEELNNKALYELESVTRRFGGKYSRMMLVCRNTPTNVYKKRATSIGIDVIKKDDLLK